MSDSDSDTPASGPEPFVETEHQATVMHYEHGVKAHVLVIVLWLVSLLALGIYTAILLVPDLMQWGAP